MMQLAVLIAEFMAIGNIVDIVSFTLSMTFMYVRGLRFASV